ncbi:unnamed protein product [Lactuca saligna]|uniref:non-specific serine/threonine protein kinase n=1 Tax=Lactuca saligna TaxID=75948 RepID=A0AA36E637_LACSI|nr:unnamed protein product [Lactuca saligna]
MEFAKHGSRLSNVSNWKTKIWIANCDGQKIKIAKTCLLKYYKGDVYKRPHNENVHRDQFLTCSICNKVRRFELRSRETCRFYHDAVARENPTCSDMIPGRWTCEDLEERVSSRIRTGCRKNIRCKGCLRCVCFGCNMFGFPSPSPQPQPPDQHQIRLAPPLAVAFSFLIALTLWFCKFTTRKRTAPSDSKPPHKFSYTALNHATSSLSPSNRLGQGGFGSVYRGTLINSQVQDVAVKVMDAGSLQGEREFQNELFFAGKIDYDRILVVVGFSSDRRRRRMVLVYELMTNGSLQDCLFHRKSPELKEWKKRLSVAIDIAKGIEYLHHYCDPPIIHGDIKPSNILLDHNFNAKIGDFGLARLKPEDECRVDLNIKIEEGKKVGNSIIEDNGSVFEETESLATTTVCEELSIVPDQSPESFVTAPIAETSPETFIQSPKTGPASDVSFSEGNLDVISLESGGATSKKSRTRKTSMSGKDWWWKQDNSMSESGRVKDYVMEWIGSEIKKERPKTEWITTGAVIQCNSSATQTGKSEKKKPKKNKKRLDWWMSLDEDKNVKKHKRRPAREWWKEEYSEELAKKKKPRNSG